tara:strand:+ start:260 stop:580 length:321 start_codon:yes stop_codon:yes gene_type:complete
MLEIEATNKHMFTGWQRSDILAYLAEKGYDVGTNNASSNTMEDIKLAASIHWISERITRQENKGSDLIDESLERLKSELRRLENNKNPVKRNIDFLHKFNDENEFF